VAIYLDKRSGRFFVQFDYKKQTFKQYLPKGSTRTAAQRLETKMRSDAFFQANGMTPRDEILFEDCVQDYLAHIKHTSKYDRAEDILTAAKPFLKGKLLRSIDSTDIEKFIHFRTIKPTPHGTARMPATIWREVSVISAFFSYAIKKKRCETNPCKAAEKPSFDNTQIRVLEYKDEAKFLASFDAKGKLARDICILVLNTGLRQNDVLGLTDFQCTGHSIRLLQGKVKRVVEIPLNQAAREIIAKYSGKGLLFPSPKFKNPRPMQYIRKAITGACERAEIPKVTIRDLRRTFATRLAENGVDALTIAMLLGHSDLRMVHRYARSSETMRKAVEKLPESTLYLPSQKLQVVK